jgi:transposase
MDARQERGIEIAKQARIRKTVGGWMVPSQGRGGSVKYAVIVAADTKTCTCPDYELRGLPCKHVFAVEYLIQRELFPDGSETVTESVRVTETVTRKTYPQNWRAYNKAQTNEKDRFMGLLRDLCAGLPEPTEKKRGRPRLLLRDAVFTAVMKVYTTASARRSMSDLREAKERGYISKLPCHNSVLSALESADMTAILRDLIIESSLPLKAVESDFAVDSSGFTTSRFQSWFDHKYGHEQAVRHHTWVKAHIMCGTKTNVVTAVEIHGQHAADTKQLPALVETTARNFAIAEVSADKAYGSLKNAEAIQNVGATPFISFRSNSIGTGGGAWSKMFGYFMYRREEFLAHYHKRSNVESTFSMIKRKFGDSLRSKTPTAQVNETLAKLLCHNLVVLIHEAYELGVAPAFWAENDHAQQTPA